MSELVLEELSTGYPGRGSNLVVSRGISVSAQMGEFICLVGPNGAGKSTLLRTICGMQAPLAGTVSIDTIPVHSLKPRQRAQFISVVLTDRLEIDALPVRSLVELGRHPRTDWTGRLTPADQEAVQRSLKDVSATDLADRLFGELSDGERQRVMIARALAQEPSLLVLDEVTAFLDFPRRIEVMRVLKRLTRSRGRSVIVSTHDLNLAIRTADTLWLLPRKGDLEFGVPEDLILNGSFKRAFEREGVSFDLKTGTFSTESPTGPEVGLIGDGIRSSWTERALARVGFQTRPGSVIPLRVELLPTETWSVHCNGHKKEVGSIQEVLESLEEFGAQSSQE